MPDTCIIHSARYALLSVLQTFGIPWFTYYGAPMDHTCWNSIRDLQINASIGSARPSLEDTRERLWDRSVNFFYNKVIFKISSFFLDLKGYAHLGVSINRLFALTYPLKARLNRDKKGEEFIILVLFYSLWHYRYKCFRNYSDILCVYSSSSIFLE